MQGLALTLPQLTLEFGVSESTVRYTTMITFIGLSLGSTFWGLASDIIGRRPAFNATLFICGAFGTAVAFGPSWIGTAILFACMGMGVGGNLPVDGALFLEFLPFDSNRLLTLLSVWWPVGQLLAAISESNAQSHPSQVKNTHTSNTVGWAIIPPFSCDPELKACSLTNNEEPCCHPKDNRGWRYFIFTLGMLTLFMFFCRFFLFHLYESPKFFLSRNQPSRSVSVVHGIAHHNGAKTWLTEDLLEELGGGADTGPKVGVAEISRRNASEFSLDRVRALFVDRKLAITTVLLWVMWFAIGLGFPLFNAFLPQYLEHAGQDGGGTVSTGEVCPSNIQSTPKPYH
jgi:MFS family permease